MKIIAVIGAGTMGSDCSYICSKVTVKLIDLSEKSLDKGMATIAANWIEWCLKEQ
jgi:3-hydroxybutyryl-CoA dehydrogenase